MQNVKRSVAALLSAAAILLCGCGTEPPAPEPVIETPEPTASLPTETSRDLNVYIADDGFVDSSGEAVFGYALDEERNIRTDYGKLVISAENAERFTVVEGLEIADETQLHPHAQAVQQYGGELSITPIRFKIDLSVSGSDPINPTLSIESQDPAALFFPLDENPEITLQTEAEIYEGALPSLQITLDENGAFSVTAEGRFEGRHLIIARNLYGAAFQAIEVEIIPEYYIEPSPKSDLPADNKEQTADTDEEKPHEHFFENNEIQATAKTQGYTEHICRECGYCFRDSYTLKTDCEHQYESTIIPATYTTQGYTLFVCKLCGDVFRARETQQIECLHSKTKDTVVKPTCTEKGYTIHDCLICRNYSWTDNEKEPLGHLWDNGRTSTFATCVDSGEKLFTCRRCRETRTEPIPPTGKHKYKAVTTKPTCTEDGYTTHTCTVCGDSYTDKMVAAYGHSRQLDWYTTTKPTCGSDGERSGYCRRCGEIVETETVPATGRHQWIAKVIKPTTTEAGYTEHTCTVCGDTYRDNEVPPTG